MKITITYRFIVGIDISKKWLDLYLYDQKTTRDDQLRVANDRQGFQEIGNWLAEHQVGRSQVVLCSEHTGRYGERLLGWSTEQNWPHAVVKTTALQQVSAEHHRKTDRYDARKLAEYARRYSDRLRLRTAPKEAVKQIKRFKSERKAMVDDRAALKQKCSEADYHNAQMDDLKSCWQQQISLLSEHISQLEDRIQTLIDENSYLNELYSRMRTAPGLGKVITPVWISMFAGRKKLNPKKISSRFGFAPHPSNSGSSVSKPSTSSGYGNSYMRRLMHEAARSVATHYDHYSNYYQRKLAEGKHELVVINNIINKLIRLYCAMWNSKSEYDPNYIQKCKQRKKAS